MKSVLLLDDDKAITKLLTMYLAKQHVNIKAINQPEHLFNNIKSVHPDLIIMDLMMPKIDGLSLLKKIKDSEYKNIPVLIISAKNYKSTILSCLAAGAYDFLPKPFTLDTLKRTISTLITT